MPNVLAIDTATDACSVALRMDGNISHRYEVIPREHSQRLLPMLQELMPGGALREQGVELLAFSHGPGSFTGLRIAASAVQGLAFSNDLPAVGLSTLACLAQGAWRRGLVESDARVLVLLDARIGEVYWGLYDFDGTSARALRADNLCAPGEVALEAEESTGPLVAVGSGLCYVDDLAVALAERLDRALPDLWPDSRDLLELADREYERGNLLGAAEVQPVYLRNKVQWKKLSEQ